MSVSNLAEARPAPADETGGNSAGLSATDIARLNADYADLHFEERIARLYADFEPAKVLVTSSFAATSAYFLHIISRIRPDQKIAFINTGYHFKETLLYKNYLSELLELETFDLKAEGWKHQFTRDDQTWDKNPDFCCSINKIEPLEAVKPNYHVWVSSLMRWQTPRRAAGVRGAPRHHQVQPDDRREPRAARCLHRRARTAVPPAGDPRLQLDRLHSLHRQGRRPQWPLAGQAEDRVRAAPLGPATASINARRSRPPDRD